MHALGNRALFFLHVPKTAGTSLRDLLSSRFAPTDILAFERGDSPETRGEKLSTIDRYPFVHGHVPYALVDRFAHRPFVVTVLRHPLERALSAFHYMQRQAPAVAQAVKDGRVSVARARDFAASARMSIGEFVRDEPLAAARHLGNLQAWLLATPNVHERFAYGDDHRVSVSGADLARAKANLAACDAVGLTERMPESVALLAHALRTRPFGEIGTANRTRARPGIATLDTTALASLEALTARDGELYDFARQLFGERHEAMIRQRLVDGADHSVLAAGPSALASAPLCAFDGPIPGTGWYSPERFRDGWFSWTGPTCESTLELASPPGGACVLELRAVHAMKWEFLSQLDVRLNGVRLHLRLETQAGGHILRAPVPADVLHTPGAANAIVIRTPSVLRPCEEDPASHDSRLLGIAVSRVELVANEPPAASKITRWLRA